jgi:hypothetical protein
MAPGFTQPVTEMSTGRFLEVKLSRACERIEREMDYVSEQAIDAEDNRETYCLPVRWHCDVPFREVGDLYVVAILKYGAALWCGRRWSVSFLL